MKFVYEYRTSDNVPHRGTIAASTKEAAYDTLKARGIKPGKVWEAPGLLNKIFGKGKRWIAIGVLLAALACAYSIVVGLREQVKTVANELKTATTELEDLTLYEDRGQIYGAKPVLAEMQLNDFESVFGDDSISRFLAAYAIPGVRVASVGVTIPKSSSRAELVALVPVADSDLEEVKHLKRIVNGMKRELGRYLDAGGTVETYVQRLNIRQEAEYGIYSRTKRELSNERSVESWREKNTMLRAKGLPMVDLADEEK